MRNHLLTHSALAVGLIGAALIVSPAYAIGVNVGGGSNAGAGVSVGAPAGVGIGAGAGVGLNTNVGARGDSSRINTQSSGAAHTRINPAPDSVTINGNSDMRNSVISATTAEADEAEPIILRGSNSARFNSNTDINALDMNTDASGALRSDANANLRRDSNLRKDSNLRSDASRFNTIAPAAGARTNNTILADDDEANASGGVLVRSDGSRINTNVRTNTGTTATGTGRVRGGANVSGGASGSAQ